MGSNEVKLSEPTAEDMLAAVLRFGRELFISQTESEIAEKFLDLLRDLFHGRYFALRLVDLRGTSRIRVHGDSEALRPHLAEGRLRLKKSAIAKTQIKGAVAESAHLRHSERWDSPFQGVAAGFCIPLAIAGELYGVLDVGYALGRDNSERDEASILPLANQFASALRNERLYHDTKSLRDYQSRLIEHASALILGIDSDWRIRVCNMALCDLIGVPKHELLGKDLRDCFPAVDRPRLMKYFSDGMNGLASDVGESELVSSNDRHVPVVWRVSAIRSRGAVQAVVAVGQDQSVLSDLQMQLVQAEKMSSMGQIAAGVVHELNNPLTAIGVYSEFLIKKLGANASAPQSQETGADDIEKLESIRTNAERIRAFAQELMQYAKPSSGHRIRLSVNQVVNQSLAFCAHLFSNSGVVLERNLDASVPDILAVPGQLEQVIVNLVTNAVHACGNQGRVEVRSYIDEDRVVVAVKDEGPGIAAADQQRIFEPFFTTKTDGEGTGLGLCIVRNIVETNSGVLTLNSDLGLGAEFRCALPVFSEGP